MTKRVLVLYGGMAGRELDLPDDVADQGIAEKWAFDPFTPFYPQPFPQEGEPLPTPEEVATRTELAIAAMTAQRDEGSSTTPPPVVGPHIDTITPASASIAAALGSVVYQVAGTGFTATSVVEMDQLPASGSTFVSATEMSFSYDADAAVPHVFEVTVRDNAIEEESNSVSFPVVASASRARAR